MVTMQVLAGYKAELMLGAAASLQRGSFLDTAADLLRQHRAHVGLADLSSAEAHLRLRIAQVWFLNTFFTETVFFYPSILFHLSSRDNACMQAEHPYMGIYKLLCCAPQLDC